MTDLERQLTDKVAQLTLDKARRADYFGQLGRALPTIHGLQQELAEVLDAIGDHKAALELSKCRAKSWDVKLWEMLK